MMKFTEPSTHIGSIVQYQVQCIRDNVETIMEITSKNETIVTITNLIPLAKYQCKVSYIFYYSTEDWSLLGWFSAKEGFMTMLLL